MAFTSGQWGPDTFIDADGNTKLIGATVTAVGYVCTVDSLGNLTVVGPATDALTVTVSPAVGADFTAEIAVLPTVAELDTVRGLAVAAETTTGAQTKATTAKTEAIAAAATAASATYPAKAGVETISGAWHFSTAPTGITGGGGSGLPSTIVNRTTTYTATAGDLVLADATAGAFTVTLPAAPATGALVTVKKVDATASAVTVAVSGGGTVEGLATASIVSQYAGAVFEHVGSNVWYITAPATTNQGPPGTNGTNGTNGLNAALSIVQDEGVALTQRDTLNFVGAGVTAADSGGKTVVTIPGGGTGTTVTGAEVATNQSIASSSFTDLTTVGPAVTITVPASGIVTLHFGAQVQGQSGSFTQVGFAATGGNTIAASDDDSAVYGLAVGYATVSKTKTLTGLTPGSTTFTLKYKQSGASSSAVLRRFLTAIY